MDAVPRTIQGKRGRGMIVFVHENDYFERTPLEKQRVCCNCRNRKTSVIESKCMIDGHYIGYVQCFTNWCLHWATDKLNWLGGDT